MNTKKTVDQFRYDPATAAVFYRVREHWGAFSNFAPFPVAIALLGETARFATSEALYQALKHDDPHLQRQIAAAASPAEAKRLSWTRQCRDDLDLVAVMRWVVALKADQHLAATFGPLLRATGERPIVEMSKVDAFWGAVAQPDGRLAGQNWLGRIWMDVRAAVVGGRWPDRALLTPPEGLVLFGQAL